MQKILNEDTIQEKPVNNINKLHNIYSNYQITLYVIFCKCYNKLL